MESFMSAVPNDTAFPAEITADVLAVTELAGQKFAELISDADDGISGVRVYVAGGGCGGMNYGMTFAEEVTRHDSVYQGEAFSLYIDPVALNYMDGAEIDYVDDGISATFVFNNVFQAVGGSGACSGCGGAM
jgi:iron-sulfur cluster insertion protein